MSHLSDLDARMELHSSRLPLRGRAGQFDASYPTCGPSRDRGPPLVVATFYLRRVIRMARLHSFQTARGSPIGLDGHFARRWKQHRNSPFPSTSDLADKLLVRRRAVYAWRERTHLRRRDLPASSSSSREILVSGLRRIPRRAARSRAGPRSSPSGKTGSRWCYLHPAVGDAGPSNPGPRHRATLCGLPPC